eukprot:CAMPEP_0172498568 /NCGR_PEP_ID=MMETSP1066-20121228/113803_1 /TAXON_ID=671091 /ORGANISM="Coscinodiscus wailesii, Strain CCMP2513" /LENGTH=123 /DNA_ID=CAMNT_0013271881 /DNA_START=13 /DNA_END=381 /DNA_ORIENTATION=+
MLPNIPTQHHLLPLLILLLLYLPPSLPRLAGAYHTCTFLPNLSVKCWGNNKFGQLGLGDWNYRGGDVGQMGDNLPPIDLGTGRSVLHISPGDSHTCAVLDDESLKCWGRNSIGQLGLGDTVHR